MIDSIIKKNFSETGGLERIEVEEKPDDTSKGIIDGVEDDRSKYYIGTPSGVSELPPIDRGVSNNSRYDGERELDGNGILEGSLSSSTSSSALLSSSSSSHLSKLSINRFEDEYYYDEERAIMDRKAVRLLEQEAEISQRESNLTGKIMIAATCICCLAFGLLLFFVLDPLGRGSLLDKT